MSQIFALIVLALTLLSGCSAIKNMDDMKNSTDQMNGKMTTLSQQMQQTDQTTEQVSQTSQQMNDKESTLEATGLATYEDLRQGNAAALRSGNNQLQDLDATGDVGRKFGVAGVYFSSFEFQLIKAADLQNPSHLQTLYLEAVQQFFYDINPYIVDAKYSNSPDSDKNYMKDLYALSMALDQVNPNVAELYAADGIEPVSMLSLIENSIEAAPKVASGEVSIDSLPAYQRAVLGMGNDTGNLESAVYLLQVRAGFAASIALCHLADLGNIGQSRSDSVFADLGNLFSLKLRHAVWDILAHWTPNLAKTDDVTLLDYTKLLKISNDTRDFLKANGYEANIDGLIMRIYDHMNPIKDAASVGTSETALIRAQAIAGLQAQIDSLRGTKTSN